MTREEAERYATLKGWTPRHDRFYGDFTRWTWYHIPAAGHLRMPDELPTAVFGGLTGGRSTDTHWRTYETQLHAYTALYQALERLDPVLLALAGD